VGERVIRYLGQHRSVKYHATCAQISLVKDLHVGYLKFKYCFHISRVFSLIVLHCKVNLKINIQRHYFQTGFTFCLTSNGEKELISKGRFEFKVIVSLILLSYCLKLPHFPGHMTLFFLKKCDLNSTCVLCAEGKYYFQTYK
jgi:hypothetical protein